MTPDGLPFNPVYDFEPKGEDSVSAVVPIPDNGNGEGFLTVVFHEDKIEFIVCEKDEGEPMYSVTESYEDFCDHIEARDLYLDAMLEQAKAKHPTSLPRLQVIDGGGNK